MKNEEYIPLNRQFSLVTKNDKGVENEDFYYSYGRSDTKGWDKLDDEFRSVILAEAGAGKTEELRNRATFLSSEGRASFFIRIEDIEADFREAFDIGTEEQFEEWLESTEEAWFFLDSVDEARLESPIALRKALRRFAKSIECGAHRAHIYLSSRPYAWRPNEDRRLFDEFLFLTSPDQESNESVDRGVSPQSALNVYVIKPLDKAKIRQFSESREAEDIDQMLMEIERANLWSLAERPFDLDSILSKWNEERVLGGRLELLRYNIDKRLRDDHNCDRSQQRILTLERAKEGACRLAAAVVLSGEAGINIPDGASTKSGINAETVLADWSPADVRSLLELGVFNDVLFNVVRFRHREVRELLAAEWFDGLLRVGNSRYKITELFFREQYGEKIVTPRLRSILPWLIIFDGEIRDKTLEIQPEIALEGGDPSKLPLLERIRILFKVVSRIVSNEDDHSARDNSAIARIANKDLSQSTLQLIEKYRENDDAIFFLGRLIWQGDMKDCISPMLEIAADSSRGIYSRIASSRAVMNSGTEEQKEDLWQRVNETECEIPTRFLSELIDGMQPSVISVESIIKSLGKLPPFKKYDYSGLSSSLHDYIKRFQPVTDEELLSQLLGGLYRYLNKAPYVERGECHVSKDNAWLLNHAIHALELLVEVKSKAVLGSTAISILLMVPALRFWRSDDLEEHRSNLHKLIPKWLELNDILYWASIEQVKIQRVEKKSELLTNDFSVAYLEHFWAFDQDSLSRLLNLLHFKIDKNDKLIILSTAYRVYVNSGNDNDVLNQIEQSISENNVLGNRLKELLNPKKSELMQEYENKSIEREREIEIRAVEDNEVKSQWISELKANPARVYDFSNLEQGSFTNDQYWLLREINGSGISTNRSEGADWKSLVPEFGCDVANAYRASIMKLWRVYHPTLQSEGNVRDNSIPWSLILSMAGLQVEFIEIENFPFYMNESEVEHMLRYLTWEMDGFPAWFEKVYKAFPTQTEKAVMAELSWELENKKANAHNSPGYILSALAHCAQWMHHSLTPLILGWLKANISRINENRHDCMRILLNGGIDVEELIELATLGLGESKTLDDIGWWYAVLVDCNPSESIPRVKTWLLKQSRNEAKKSALVFITALIGSRCSINQGSSFGCYRTPEHLKEIYVLMHYYISTAEDIDRSNQGVYSPGLRDDAQDARNSLFNLLSAIPGKESYRLIKKLEQDHPDKKYRPVMAKQAYKKAEEDGDLELWTDAEVWTFHDKQMIKPRTHQQLFDLTLDRLTDLKNWLERGNDSPWQTWQRVAGENEMRNLIAGWLNLKCGSHYTTAQEPELANNQRMDIWMHNTSVQSPVPIELKLLDKKWSGPDLCERLRNQLAGDYLREQSAYCGVMLLVACKLKPNKKWMIDNKKVGIKGLAGALKTYWESISINSHGVSDIEIVVIDLNERKLKCDS